MLTQNQTITFSVAFAPQQLGALEAAIDIATNAGDFAVPISGTGITNVGMGEALPKAPLLSPNPALDYTLISHTTEIAGVVLVSAIGAEVMRMDAVGSKQVTLWLATLPNGLYYAMVTDLKGKVFKVKLLIQH
jgi:hypothetical protein